jgi:hypothetical protein
MKGESTKAANGLYVAIDDDPNDLIKDYGAVKIRVFNLLPFHSPFCRALMPLQYMIIL